MNITSVLTQLRATTPLVHCLTNTVVPQITANVLLAAGAAPAMIDLPEEAGIFAGIASAVLINVGNGSSEQHTAQRVAAKAAHECGGTFVATAGVDDAFLHFVLFFERMVDGGCAPPIIIGTGAPIHCAARGCMRDGGLRILAKYCST